MNYLSGSFDVRGYGFTRARALPRGKQTKKVSTTRVLRYHTLVLVKKMGEAGYVRSYFDLAGRSGVPTAQLELRHVQKVTRIGYIYMFYVRSARALALTALSRALPVHADCVAATQRPHASRAVPLLASHSHSRRRAGAQETALEIRSARVLLERL